MATKKRKTRRKSAATAPKRRRRKNSTQKIVVLGPRRNSRRRSAKRNPSKRRTRRVVRHSRNPIPGGGGRGTLEMVLGGLAGVAIAKTVPGMILPASFQNTPITKALSSAATAYLAGWAVGKYLRQPRIGEGIMFGGLMEGGSTLLTAYVPQLSGYGFGGLGMIMPGYVNPPVNPVTYRPMVAAAPSSADAGMRGSLQGINAAFGGAL